MRQKERPMLWCEKYSPSSVDEVAGNQTAKDEVKKWALDFSRGKRAKPVLLHGPPGVGKTALAQALAREMGWEIIETNASDLRDAETMHKLLGLSSSSGGLFGNMRLLLLDEVDGAFDRGEIPEMTRIIKDASQPVMLAANDIWAQKLAPLRVLCHSIEMRKVNAASVRDVLEKIAGAEKIECAFIEEIAKSCNGDLRSAINDLQANCTGGAELAAHSNRDREKSVFDAVRTVFKTTSYNEAVFAGDDLDIDLDLFVKWLDENIPAEYEKPEEVAKALDWVSRSSVFNARIYKRQAFQMLRYVRSVSLGGVATSKAAPYHKFVKYAFPSAIKALSSSRRTRGLIKSASLKIAAATHSSSREAKSGTIPFLADAKGAAEYFKLTEEEETALKEMARKR